MNGLRLPLGPLTLATYYVGLPSWTYIFNAIAQLAVDITIQLDVLFWTD